MNDTVRVADSLIAVSTKVACLSVGESWRVTVAAVKVLTLARIRSCQRNGLNPTAVVRKNVVVIGIILQLSTRLATYYWDAHSRVGVGHIAETKNETELDQIQSF